LQAMQSEVDSHYSHMQKHYEKFHEACRIQRQNLKHAAREKANLQAKISRLLRTASPDSIEIIVELIGADASVFSFEVRSGDTIRCIKGMIGEDLGCDPRELRLEFGGQMLEDSRSLASYSVNHQGRLFLLLPASRKASKASGEEVGKIQLLVKTVNALIVGPIVVPLTLKVDERIGNVKAVIFEKIGVPASQQRLVAVGEVLNSDCTWSDYDITSGSSLFVVPKRCLPW